MVSLRRGGGAGATGAVSVGGPAVGGVVGSLAANARRMAIGRSASRSGLPPSMVKRATSWRSSRMLNGQS